MKMNSQWRGRPGSKLMTLLPFAPLCFDLSLFRCFQHMWTSSPQESPCSSCFYIFARTIHSPGLCLTLNSLEWNNGNAWIQVLNSHCEQWSHVYYIFWEFCGFSYYLVEIYVPQLKMFTWWVFYGQTAVFLYFIHLNLSNILGQYTNHR